MRKILHHIQKLLSGNRIDIRTDNISIPDKHNSQYHLKILDDMGVSIDNLNYNKSASFPGGFCSGYAEGNSYFIKCNNNSDKLIISYLLLCRGFYCTTFKPNDQNDFSDIYVNTTVGYFQHAYLPEWASDKIYKAEQFIVIK